MPFPIIKLVTLIAKQLSKPLTNAVKHRAKTSPAFRKICSAPANVYHRWDIQMRTKLLGFKSGPLKKDIQPMNSERAVELGAELIGEFTVYSVAVLLLYAEYYYSSKSNERKESDKKLEFENISNEVLHLSLNVATLEAELREAQRTLGELSSQNHALMEKVYGS
ncbi:optic atrophy 3 protein homolog [Mya arenaria]|uniref:optic atrophy 3 protein homolog n=1 Tax=Mya arenaria TaxID=6604 RepID=UPI0022E40E51|nr:optic atrophy 3 protein homolog [Mya arenaria]